MSVNVHHLNHLVARLLFTLTLLLALQATSPALAQTAALTRRSLPARPAPSPPAIDGDVADPVWKDAPKAATFSDPVTDSTEIDQTEAWLLYDDNNVYVAIYAHDAEPDKIVGREIRRDTEFQGEDSVSFTIDPYHVHRFDDTNQFTVNALGTQSSQIAGGRAGKTEWKGDWLAVAKRVADGWTVEMQIPWSILNYPSPRGPATVGINFFRRQERTKIRSYWSNIGTRFENELAGHWEGVQLPRSKFRPTLSLLPYTATGYREQAGFSLHSGLDARTALTPELTAVGTLNPDFENVEAAIEGIEFSRSERFVPDVRPFFLEGEDIFNVGSRRGIGELFHSRRIPAFDVGAKLYGKVGGQNTVGLLSTFDFGNRTDLIGRYRRRFSDDLSIGTTLVHRSLPGDTNTVLALDPYYKFGYWQLRTEYANSSGTDAGGDAGSASLYYQADRVSVSARYGFVDPNFRIADGFVAFTDFRGWSFSTRYRNEYRTGPIRYFSVELDAQQDKRYDGTPFRRTRQLESWIQTRSDWAFTLGWDGGRFLDERDNEFSIGLTQNYSNRYRRIGLRYAFGTRASAPISYWQPRITMRVLKNIDIGWSASILHHTEDRQQHILTINREISPQRAIGARMTLRDGKATVFLSYRRSGTSGMETFILLGDPDPNDPGFDPRFITKVVWPL